MTAAGARRGERPSPRDANGSRARTSRRRTGRSAGISTSSRARTRHQLSTRVVSVVPTGNPSLHPPSRRAVATLGRARFSPAESARAALARDCRPRAAPRRAARVLPARPSSVRRPARSALARDAFGPSRDAPVLRQAPRAAARGVPPLRVPGRGARVSPSPLPRHRAAAPPLTPPLPSPPTLPARARRGRRNAREGAMAPQHAPGPPAGRRRAPTQRRVHGHPPVLRPHGGARAAAARPRPVRERARTRDGRGRERPAPAVADALAAPKPWPRRPGQLQDSRETQRQGRVLVRPRECRQDVR